MNPAYNEYRPTYLGESAIAITVVVGQSLAGAIFTAAFYDPNGNVLTAPTVTITDPVNGVISIAFPTVPLTSIPGLYRYTCNWTSNGNLLVSYGEIEYTDPVGQHS